MDRVLFGLECWIYDGLEEYLLSLPGVIEVIISDKTTFFVDIKYASNITSSKVLKLETYFYLNI